MLKSTQPDKTVFCKDKYVDLAGANKTGIKLRNQVETHWVEWVAKVASAPWLRNWTRSQLIGCAGCTPQGHLVTPTMVIDYEKNNKGPLCVQTPEELVLQSSIAIAIFSSAVWGFGVDDWLRKVSTAQRGIVAKDIGPGQYGLLDRTEHGARGQGIRIHDAMAQILKFQEVNAPCSLRTYFWSDTTYNDISIAIPCEYYDLDCWLEQLYQKIL